MTAEKGAQQTVIRIDASALSIIAMLLATAAFVIVIVQASSNPQITDAKIQAAVAKAEETAHAANTNARVALEHEVDIKTQLAVLQERLKAKEK